MFGFSDVTTLFVPPPRCCVPLAFHGAEPGPGVPNAQEVDIKWRIPFAADVSQFFVVAGFPFCEPDSRTGEGDS